MRAIRIIPTLLSDGFGLVKGSGFDPWRRVGSLAPAVKVHAMRMLDELLILNVDRRLDTDLIRGWARLFCTPLTVGGGITSIGQIEALLAAGADRISICTETSLISEAARRFGRQCILGVVDYRDTAFTNCGKTDTGERPEKWARHLSDLGAGEILLQSIDREGTMEGYDLETIRKVADAVSVPVTASGGAGTYRHMVDAVGAGASAVAAGAMFQFTEATPHGAAQALHSAGVTVRLQGVAA